MVLVKRDECGPLYILTYILTFLLVIPSIPITISSLIIGVKYQNSTCDDVSGMSLATWLFVNAGVTVAYCIIGILLFFAIKKSGHADNFYVFIMVSSLLLLCFKAAWNITGSIILFVRGVDCFTEARPLWDLTLGILIIQWLILVISMPIGLGWCIKDTY